METFCFVIPIVKIISSTETQWNLFTFVFIKSSRNKFWEFINNKFNILFRFFDVMHGTKIKQKLV